MAYNQDLAERISKLLSNRDDVVEKKMFGGIGYMVQGHMACGVHKQDLVLRVGPEKYGETISQPFTKPFDITGRPMKGWLMVKSEGCFDETRLLHLVNLGVTFALSLPPK